jgi:5-methylcytosine-specific restriction endonuclease McrA
MKREIIKKKYNGLCAYTGKQLGEDWQVDHVTPRVLGVDERLCNLVPACRIINHYKRDRKLEEFRDLMLTFHVRLGKLPKKTSVSATERRIKYMNEIARLFGITPDNPFDGKFYFEKL